MGLRTLHNIAVISFLLLSSYLAKAQKPASVVVTVLLGTDCPISQKYSLELNSLYDEYKDNNRVVFQFFVPYYVRPKAIRQYKREFGTVFPVKSAPPTSRLLDTVTTVPVAFVVSDNKLIYSGAIDNWFYDLGKYRQYTTEHYLSDAIASALAGKIPDVGRTQPVGCLLPKKKKNKNHPSQR